MNGLSTLEKAEALLPQLSEAEKEVLLRQLYALRGKPKRGIRKTPAVCGGRACIEGTRVPVWTLVQFRQEGLTEIEILYNFPALTPVDLKNAWAYHLANPEEIAADMEEQEGDA
jgi:uncharacterized protein (DUF433 family)